MKKLFIIVSILIFSNFLFSCNLETSNNDKLTKNKETEIKEIYINYMNNKFNDCNYKVQDVQIKYYLGKYNNAEVVIIENDTKKMNVKKECNRGYFVSNIYFEYLPEFISVYYENEYYRLQDAFENSILLYENINSIKEKFKVIVDKLYLYPLHQLTENDEITIKSIYSKHMNEIDDTLEYEQNNFQIKYYLCRLDNGSHAAVIKGDILTFAISQVDTDGYYIGFKYFKCLPEVISIYYDNKYFRIQEAYDLQYLTKEDIEIIYIYFQNIINDKEVGTKK